MEAPRLDHDNIIKAPTPSKYNDVNVSKDNDVNVSKRKEDRMKDPRLDHENIIAASTASQFHPNKGIILYGIVFIPVDSTGNYIKSHSLVHLLKYMVHPMRHTWDTL